MKKILALSLTALLFLSPAFAANKKAPAPVPACPTVEVVTAAVPEASVIAKLAGDDLAKLKATMDRAHRSIPIPGVDLLLVLKHQSGSPLLLGVLSRAGCVVGMFTINEKYFAALLSGDDGSI